MAIGFAHQVAGTSDVHPFTLVDIPLVMMRGDDGIVRVFHNICPYDAYPVVFDDASGLKEIIAP
tara:strand:- start:154 stop:345 length:192 start_codon:yes stop_codon:yes gene_type:complete